MKMLHLLLTAAALVLSTPALASSTVLTEGFDSGKLPAGWITYSQGGALSEPWFQGYTDSFTAQAGAGDSYFASSFDMDNPATGVIDNWLLTPTLSLGGDSTLTFYTRTADTDGLFSDALEVLFSSGGGTSAAGFTQTLLSIGTGSAYPDGWTAYTVSIDLVGNGRFAFHYFGNYASADFIGLDSVTAVTAVPEPSAWLMFGAGLLLVGLMRCNGAKARRTALAVAVTALSVAPLASAAGQVAG